MSQATSNIVQLAKMRRMARENATIHTRPRILFVDDEERILNSLRALFRMQYDVTIATDGYHALELLQQHHVHLLVSDQRMPTMQGVELLRRAKELSPYTVRILLTGFADLAAIVGSVNEGEVYRYINKPWDSEELNGIINEAINVGLDLAKLLPADEALPKPSSLTTMPIPTRPNLHLVPAAPIEQAPASEPEIIANVALLFMDQYGELLQIHQESGLKGYAAFHARSPEEALLIMQQHEVGIIVANIDGEDSHNLDFLYLLKKEHPHIIALAAANLGDSETIISLVNAARVYRVIFYPLRPRVLKVHLESALKQVDHYRAQPTLLKVQQAAPTPPSSSVVVSLSTAIKSRFNVIKSFFRKR